MNSFYPRKIFFLFPIILIGLLFLEAREVFCQNSGLKYFKNYSPKDYDHQPQNWSIVQDKRGIIYVGNQGGLLEFDGVSWRLIYRSRAVRSMAIDDSGILYIGGKNEIGFFAPDSRGALHYVSLLDYIDDNQSNFGNVWKTHATKEGIYFQTSKFLFHWNSGQMKVWLPDHLFQASFSCKGRFFIHQRKVGLFHLVNDSLKLVPGGETFAGKRIYMMVPYDTKRLLIGTKSKGLYLYDGNRAIPFLTGADDYLKEKQISHGIWLACGDFAITTRLGGLVVLDSQGALKQIFNKDSGLRDNTVWYVSEDSQGNLWLALNNGLAKIEYTSPISTCDTRANLHGLILSVSRHGLHKDLYVGTSNGLYSLASPGKFRLIPGMSGMCFSLLSIGDSLLAATTNGVFQVRKNIKQMVIESPSYVLHRSGIDAKRIWVGTAFGLISLYLAEGNWTEERKFERITEEIRSIVEDQKGNLWLGTLTKGVLKVDFPSDGVIIKLNPAVIQYGSSHGLPTEEVHVFGAAGHVLIASRKGIFRFNEERKTFIPDYTLGSEFAGGEKGRGVFRIAEDKNRNIWFHSESKNFQAIPQPNGTFVINYKPFLRIPLAGVNTIYPDPDGNTIWFAGNEGLIRYDTRVKKDVNLDFPSLIREVVINGRRLIYDAENFKYKTSDTREGQFPIIDYRDRNIRFEYAAPFFEAESETRYQSFLTGYDKEWSAFSSETKKDYTNLDSGPYTFRVRAKNIYENLGREASFRFKVLPPWYKTWWAILFYIVGFFLMMFLVVRWRSLKLEKEKQRLEQIIIERTKEIKEKNLQLEKQTAQLKEQSGKLKEMDRIKSRFFANISHEFRTPLTLIMGPLEQILSDYQDENLRGKADLMLRNSRRLLTLINQLLDLSRLDSGEMQLQACQQNIIAFLRGVVGSFESLVVQKKINLNLDAEKDNIPLYFDPEKMEQVICNLLVNAVKFTPRSGKVTVTVRENPPRGFLEISVCDTGIGISREQLPHIFDRFYQADSLTEPGQKGTGIGLALVKELVSLHHGEIVVDSSQGKGTEFIIRLPLGSAHLKPEEIVDFAKETFKHREPEQIPALHLPQEEEKTPEKYDEDGKKRDEKNIILIVEDNPDVRKYIREPLEPLYAVVDAEDGAQGIKTAKEIIPDLIISDIMMPGVDGYELCGVLKKDIKTSHIPIILLTAKAGEQSVIHGLETGADDYITKPFNTKILLTRIKNLIDLRLQLQQRIQRQLQLQPAEISVSSIDQEFIKELQELIETHLGDPQFNVDQLGKKLYMSRASLYRKIEALTGESPIQFIRSYRLKRAAQLLKANFGNVTEVAFEVGFSSSAYFTKCFKEKFHQLPSDYQAAQIE